MGMGLSAGDSHLWASHTRVSGMTRKSAANLEFSTEWDVFDRVDGAAPPALFKFTIVVWKSERTGELSLEP